MTMLVVSIGASRQGDLLVLINDGDESDDIAGAGGVARDFSIVSSHVMDASMG